MAGEPQQNYNEQIVLLASMFTNVSMDVINSVIDNYNGDVNLAADAIMNFSNEATEAPPEAPRLESENLAVIPVEVVSVESQNKENKQAEHVKPHQEALPATFSEVSRSTGAIPKKPRGNTSNQKTRGIFRSDLVAKFINTHNDGTRIMILMRGAPGSGKTCLAKHIVEYTVGASNQNYANHIFSTDDYFMRGSVYIFNKHDLEYAHILNQKKVCEAANKGLSPIIVDNTNTVVWELEPYVRDGVRNGYVIEIAEPTTTWARNASELSRRNTHNVPMESIMRMLVRYQKNITPEYLLKSLRLSYPADKRPPVTRNIPPISSPKLPVKKVNNTILSKLEYDQVPTCSTDSSLKGKIIHHKSPESPDEHLQTNEISENRSSSEVESMPELPDSENDYKTQKILEAQKKLELFEKVEKEWDHGEDWEVAEKSSTSARNDSHKAEEPKPPRDADKNVTEKLIEPANICDDWTQMSMSPWKDTKGSVSFSAVKSDNLVDTKNVVTASALHDNTLKDLHGTSQDITKLVSDTGIPKQKDSLPKAPELKKDTISSAIDLVPKECKFKDNHFLALKKMFKAIPRPELREILDRCRGDVNWAVDILLGSYLNNQDQSGYNDEESEEEIVPGEECQCLAAYSIIPVMEPSGPVSPVPDVSQAATVSSPVTQKKPKRELKMNDKHLELKRHIENNVIISDAHYSQHYLNTRRRRENSDIDQAGGSCSLPQVEVEAVANKDSIEFGQDKAAALPEEHIPDGTGDFLQPYNSQDNLEFMGPEDSDTESDSTISDSLEKSVHVVLGEEFLSKLDELFGRKNFRYPENIKPFVTLPMSIMSQINAYWSMSVSTQMDDAWVQSEEMIQQDEEFARQLAAKEIEMFEEGKEPEVPSLKEIMDMELAYSIYEKNVAEWRNNEPQDLAARLSREKLYNLFPDLSKDVLAEMLMAHDYNFKATIESLLISTGQSKCLEDEKGVEKYVMKKEMERKEKFLQEENKTLSEAEWPYLSDSDKPVNLDTVKFYREEAQKYYQFRNENFEKARQYFSNNSPIAASFYSEIAALHTKKYERARCLAAAYLMNYHVMNNPDQDVLDLHFLHVPEAMVNLDIFLDQAIFRLRQKNMKYKETWIITGKGNHSRSGPRIKPATKKRLKKRAIKTTQVNGGLVKAHLYPSNKMSNEIAS